MSGSVECSICLGPLERDLLALQCGHVLHAQCLLSLVSSGMTALRKCPLCRMAISAVLPIFLDFSNSEAAPSVEDDGGGGSKDICRLHQHFGDLLLLGKVARPAELNEMKRKNLELEEQVRASSAKCDMLTMQLQDVMARHQHERQQQEGKLQRAMGEVRQLRQSQQKLLANAEEQSAQVRALQLQLHQVRQIRLCREGERLLEELQGLEATPEFVAELRAKERADLETEFSLMTLRCCMQQRQLTELQQDLRITKVQLEREVKKNRRLQQTASGARRLGKNDGTAGGRNSKDAGERDDSLLHKENDDANSGRNAPAGSSLSLLNISHLLETTSSSLMVTPSSDAKSESLAREEEGRRTTITPSLQVPPKFKVTRWQSSGGAGARPMFF